MSAVDSFEWILARILAYALLHACFHLSKIELPSFPLGVHIVSYLAHTCQHVKTSAGYTGAGTLSQANFYRPECSAQVALLLQANTSLANIYIGLK